MKVLCIVSLLTLSVFAEEVYRQKRDKSKENAIDAEKDVKGVGLNDNKQNSLGCIAVQITDTYMLGTVTCYRAIGASNIEQSAVKSSSIIMESKVRIEVKNMIPNPSYKRNPVIGYNDIAVIEISRSGPLGASAQLPAPKCHIQPGLSVIVGKDPSQILGAPLNLFPTVSAKIASLRTCASALTKGQNIPNLFCVKMTGCHPDISHQGLPVMRNGLLRGILMNSVCSRNNTYSVYLAISPYILWIIGQLKNSKYIVRPC